MDFKTDTVEVKLPFPGLFKRSEMVGFRFSIAAYALMCGLYNPPIEINQIEEAQSKGKDEAVIKLITAAAGAYSWEQKKPCKVTEKIVKWWFANLKGSDLTSFMDKVNVAILNGNAKVESDLKAGKVKKK